VLRKLEKLVSKGIWQLLAVIVVLLIAGPEVYISLELFSLVELLGASTFVLMYVASFKLILLKWFEKFQSFESNLFFPTLVSLKQMPSMFVHSVPERTSIILYLLLASTGTIIMALQV
jgi:hypothetical protein